MKLEKIFRDLEALMRDTLQILDHMIVDGEKDHLQMQIHQSLVRQCEMVGNFADRNKSLLDSISKELTFIEDNVRQLEQILYHDFQDVTNQQMEQFQQMAIEEQMEQTEAYHVKIDYLSALKVRENVERMKEMVNHLQFDNFFS